MGYFNDEVCLPDSIVGPRTDTVTIIYNPKVAEEKEEGKFAPTPEGESIEYVSLEDALAMAIRHAWWHPEIYGVDYQDVSLTWKSVSQ